MTAPPPLTKAKPAPAKQPKPVSRREAWERVRRVERSLAAKLKRITVHMAELAKSFPEAGADTFQSDKLAELLDRYSKVLEPWAENQARKMVAEVDLRDRNAWMRHSKKMGRLIREELADRQDGSVGLVMEQRSREAASLISSLPSQAAQRVRDLTIEARSSGKRPAALIAEVQALGDVSYSRAKLIARTEVARTASTLTQSRAESVGSTHYIWRTVKDGDVRDSHKKMEGVVCEWANPPELSDKTVTHAGQIYNCRCFPEPIFDD